MENASVLFILTCKCAWRHSGVPFLENFSTSALLKVARGPHVFNVLTRKCASRYKGVQFLDIQSSKSGPPRRCFIHFDLEMRFAPQRRAIFGHPNFQKFSRKVSFFTSLSWKCASRHSGVPFFNMQLPKVLRRWGVLYILTWKCASRHSGGAAALASLLFDPADTKILGKTQHFTTSLTFRAFGSSFYWLSRNCSFFLLTLFLFCVLFISILSEVRHLNFLWSHSILVRTTQYYSVLQSTTQYYSVLQSITPYYSVLQNTTQHSARRLLGDAKHNVTATFMIPFAEH